MHKKWLHKPTILLLRSRLSKKEKRKKLMERNILSKKKGQRVQGYDKKQNKTKTTNQDSNLKV